MDVWNSRDPDRIMRLYKECGSGYSCLIQLFTHSLRNFERTTPALLIDWFAPLDNNSTRYAIEFLTANERRLQARGEEPVFPVEQILATLQEHFGEKRFKEWIQL